MYRRKNASLTMATDGSAGRSARVNSRPAVTGVRGLEVARPHAVEMNFVLARPEPFTVMAWLMPPPANGVTAATLAARTPGTGSTNASTSRLNAASFGPVIRRAGRCPDHQDVGDAEAAIQRAQVVQRPREQPRADHQHQRERDLRDDQRRRQAPCDRRCDPRRPSPRPAPRAMRATPARPEYQRRDADDQDRDRHHRPVRREVQRQRSRAVESPAGRHQRDQRAAPHPRHREAGPVPARAISALSVSS